MMHRLLPVVIGACLLVLAAGCRGPSLEIRISPPDVPVDRVLVDGKQVGGGGGIYRTELRPLNNETERTGTVSARSTGGVEVTQSYLVRKGDDSTRVSLTIRAQLACRILPSGEKVSLMINNTPVDVKQQWHDVEPGRITVLASNLNAGVDARATVDIRAGERKEVVLETSMAALFNANPKRAEYQQPIEFNAEASTPTGTIQSYTWEFGDGTTQPTSEKHISHSYMFDPSKWKTDQEFQVKLTIKTEGGKTETKVQPVTVFLPTKQLGFDVVVYPSRANLIIGEAAQLKLTPQNPASVELVRDLVLSFGDGSATASGELRLEREGTGCKPIIVSHVFGRAGRFEPKLTYTQPDLGLKEPQSAALRIEDRESPVLTVTASYLSENELKEKAWQDFFAQFRNALRVAGVEKSRLALTSITSANYELEEPDFVAVVDRITKMLVEDEQKYFVLEKASQVLARLAPESIIDVRREFDQQKAELAEDGGPKYRNELDYGLVESGWMQRTIANAGSRFAQLMYGLRIAGIDNRVHKLDTTAGATSGEGKLEADGRSIKSFDQKESTTASGQWLQDLPILMARFKTAEALIALKVIDEPRVEVTGPDRYDEGLREALLTRTATLKVQVRIVARTGQILKAIDIAGRYSEMVPQSYKSAQTKPS